MTAWISHRGLHEAHPNDENTMEAFRSALEVGFGRIETDLRLSADGHIVLSHDPTLDHVVGVSSSIHDLTRFQLEQLKTKKGQKLVFLDQIFESFSSIHWTFDIKPEEGLQTISALIQLAKRDATFSSWVEKKVRFLTWSKTHDQPLKEFWPQNTFYARIEECRRAAMTSLIGLSSLAGFQNDRIYSVPGSYFGMNLFRKSLVEAYHHRSMRILAFLPAHPRKAAEACEAGFDEILSDFPPLR